MTTSSKSDNGSRCGLLYLNANNGTSNAKSNNGFTKCSTVEIILKIINGVIVPCLLTKDKYLIKVLVGFYCIEVQKYVIKNIYKIVIWLNEYVIYMINYVLKRILL